MNSVKKGYGLETTTTVVLLRQRLDSAVVIISCLLYTVLKMSAFQVFNDYKLCKFCSCFKLIAIQEALLELVLRPID